MKARIQLYSDQGTLIFDHWIQDANQTLWVYHFVPPMIEDNIILSRLTLTPDATLIVGEGNG